jgi:hypothetical protein
LSSGDSVMAIFAGVRSGSLPSFNKGQPPR